MQEELELLHRRSELLFFKSITMKGEMHSLSGELEVPRYVALFAVASRAGEFI